MTTVTDIALAIVWGGLFAAGVVLILFALPRWGAASLSVRIAPYVRDVVPQVALPPGIDLRTPSLPVAGFWNRIRALLERIGGGRGLALRLAQAGLSADPVAFRARQLGWTLVGAAAGAVVLIVIAISGRVTPPAAVLPLLGGLAGAVLYEMHLTSRARARLSRLTEEQPTTLEFMALCVSAGEGILDAIRRVSTIGSGELSQELRRVVLEVNTGSPLVDALNDLSRRLDLPSLSRSIDQVTAALERGAPLAGVLHSQAADAREEAKRGLIEQAGRKEIWMLLPLVFLILPMSVLFAIYPGLFILRLGID